MSDKYFFKDKNTGFSFEYEIVKRKGLKNLRLVVRKDRKVVVRIPKSFWYQISGEMINNFLEEKKEFIFSALARYEKCSEQYPDLFNFSKEHYYQYRNSAKELIKSKVDYFCRKNNFKYRRIVIRNQATRWGSCSSKGNLNFSYRILFLTPEEQDYIVVHELCHLREQNHSKKFWKEVENILPDYRRIHKSLRLKT